MGIFHSTTTRFMASNSKPPDEEEGESPNLQNQYQPYGDYSLQILLPFTSIYKATKCLLQKVCFVFNFLRPTKTADSLLPIQNPASSEPLLVPTPHFCSPTIINDSSILENTFESQIDHLGGLGLDLDLDDEVAHSENDCHVSCSQELQEENEIDRELDVVSPTEIIEENSSCSHMQHDDEIIEEMSPANFRSVEEEERVGINSRQEERLEEDVKVQVKKLNIAVDEKERRIKHYSSRHKILLVGEGDFSFSACLAVAFVSAPNIIATSLNSKAFLKKHYGKAMSNIAELRRRGSKVMHGIDATEIANHELLRQLKYDRIIFNFPHAGFFHNMSTEDQLRHHRRLVSQFLKNAKVMISENGEIHISHKTNGFHANFKLENIASSHGLRLIEAVKFKSSHYPGYNTKYGYGGDRNFDWNPSKTFKFGLKTVPL